MSNGHTKNDQSFSEACVCVCAVLRQFNLPAAAAVYASENYVILAKTFQTEKNTHAFIDVFCESVSNFSSSILSSVFFFSRSSVLVGFCFRASVSM